MKHNFVSTLLAGFLLAFAGLAAAQTAVDNQVGVASDARATNAGNSQNLTVYGAEAPGPYSYNQSDATVTYKGLAAATAPASFGSSVSLCGAVDAVSGSVFFFNGSKGTPVEMPKCLKIMINRELGSLAMIEGERTTTNPDGTKTTSKTLVFTPQSAMRLEALCAIDAEAVQLIEASGYYVCKSTRDAREQQRAQAALDQSAPARKQPLPWQAGG